MPTVNVHQLSFGGVNDRDTPVNFPVARSVRCKNFVPQRNGRLRLRWGYTQPAMDTVVAGAIHSAAYAERFNGKHFVLFSQGADLKRLKLEDNRVRSEGTLSNGNKWGHFRANNRIHISNGVDFMSWDSDLLRTNGIRAPNSTETAAVSVSSTATPAGSFSTTLLSGYQLYLAYYNPNTGQVGNRAKIGTRQVIAGSALSLSLTGLPNLASVNPEWVKVIGRTPDGGEVPYWFIDSAGNRIVVGNTATTASITLPDVDFFAELPTRNSVGSGFDGFARVGTRTFAKKPNDPYIYYSEAEEDYEPTGIRVGRPEESWPANNAEMFPSAEVPTCVASYAMPNAPADGWFFSRNYLYRWVESLRQQLSDPWIGPWSVGCAGQRAFVVTPYGPFWLSAEKQLYTFGDGPIPAGDEYNRTMLTRIADAQLPNVELTYHRDPAKDIDQVKILGKDISGNPVIVIHDFILRDKESPFGQAYETSYAGMSPETFVGAGFSPITPVRNEANKILFCWCGTSAGRFEQLDDTTSDNGAVFSADYLSGPIAMGDSEPQLVELEYVGDDRLVFSYETDLSSALSDYQTKVREDIDLVDARAAFKISDQGSFFKVRLQLDSNLTGDYNQAEPYAIPLNMYGTIYESTLKLGRHRPEGR